MQLEANLPLWSQELWHPHRYKVVYGGRGAARSWSVARTLLLKGASQPLRILCAREMQRSIQDSVHRLLVDQIELLKIPGYEITQREIRHVITGTIFLFEGLRHNITKIKSMEGIDICWVEEAERVSKESWSVLIPTIRRPGSEIWVTFNPDQEDDNTYQRFVINPPPSAWVHKVGWEDNPWFPDELRAEKDYDYSTDPEAAEHIWGGATRQQSDAQILRGKWRVESFDPQPGWHGPYFGADFGFATDPQTLIKFWIRPPAHPLYVAGTRRLKSPGTLFIEREAYKVGLDIDKTRPFWQLHVPGCHRHVIRADNSRPETISYLKRHGLPQIVPASKWKGSIEDGIAYLRGFEGIVIHERCTYTRREARLYSYKVDPNTQQILPEVVDKHNHCIDAIRYGLSPMIRVWKGKKVQYAGTTYSNVK